MRPLKMPENPTRPQITDDLKWGWIPVDFNDAEVPAEVRGTWQPIVNLHMDENGKMFYQVDFYVPAVESEYPARIFWVVMAIIAVIAVLWGIFSTPSQEEWCNELKQGDIISQEVDCSNA